MENLSTKRIDMSTAAIYSLPSYLLQVKLTPKTWKAKDKNYLSEYSQQIPVAQIKLVHKLHRAQLT